MRARILSIDAPGALEEAVRLLAADELVVFPTDTVYGVGAHGLRDAAIRKLFEAKLRPMHKAIPLLLSDVQDVEKVGERLSPLAHTLMARYWPGALTLVVWARSGLPQSLTAGEPTVALRIPANEVTRRLIRQLGAPLAATSANVSGDAPALSASAALAALGDRVALILDGGPAPLGEASTVLDVTVEPPRILRRGPLADDPFMQAIVGSEV